MEHLKTLMLVPVILAAAACQPADLRDDNTKKSSDDNAEQAVYLSRLEAAGSADEPAETLVSIGNPANFYPLNKAAESGISTQALSEARQYLERTNSSALLVYRDNELAVQMYLGDAGEETLLDGGALAKPLGMIAVGRAIQEGFIRSLDQSAADFITEWKDSPKAAIKVRHLLDMRSGLEYVPPSTDPASISNRARLHPRHEEILINEYPLAHKPGSRYDYVDAAADLVAVLVERATGQAYEEWVGIEVLGRIRARGGKMTLNRPDGIPFASHGVHLPADSFLRMGTLLLNDGFWRGKRHFQPGFVHQVTVPTDQNPYAGASVFVAGDYAQRRGWLNPSTDTEPTLHSEPYLANDIWLFDGPGHQVLYIIPSANMVILRMGTEPPEGVEWDNSRLPNILLGGIDFSNTIAPRPQR